LARRELRKAKGGESVGKEKEKNASQRETQF
jgi:hypothetical protein